MLTEGWKKGQEQKRKMQQIQKQQRIEEYNKNPILCRQCNKPLPYKAKQNHQVYCNSSCAAQYNNAHRVYEIKNKNCLFCNKPLKAPSNWQLKQKKFCDKSCQDGLKLKIQRQSIENGEKIHYRQIKKYLLSQTGNRCNMCGLENWLNKPILLICDHIDGDRNNSVLSNMRLICSNCDATLPTYKKRNRRIYPKK